MEVHVSLVGRRDLSGEIYRQLRRAILAGRLRPGDALPPSRGLARALHVARATVTLAYERLASEGFVGARVGAGTFVLPHAARPARPRQSDGALSPRPLWATLPLPASFARDAPFDFRTGVPDAGLFPHDVWRRLLARRLRADSAATRAYGEPAGHAGLRAAIARHVSVSRGVEADAQDVTIVNGTQQALDVVARVLLRPGERVVVEDPGYRPLRWLLTSLGARVTGVPVDAEGLVVDALPRRARLVCVTPSHQYPLGVTLSLARRRALLDWAERCGAAIVEDDYDSEFRYRDRPIEPLQTLDAGGRVIYVGSFSKTMLPTLRLGFVIAPPSLREALRRAKLVADWHTPLPLQAALAEFIESGAFARHVRRARAVYATRHELITRTLGSEFAGQLELLPAAAGLHVAALARGRDVATMARLVRRAAERGVALHELARFALQPPGRAGLVLGYGAIATGRIAEGLRRLRACFAR